MNLSDDEEADARTGLEMACVMYEYELVWDGDDVVSIGTYSSDEIRKWRLFVTYRPAKNMGQFPWVAVTGGPEGIIVGEYAATAWAYCGEGETPSNAVDSTGFSYYGYGMIGRIVSLAPSCTEAVCSMGGERKIVGTDRYSNYPASVAAARADKKIADVGGYSNPSYESVVSLNPDLVVCIDSQFSHLNMAKKLRAAGYKVVVCYGGEDLSSVMENLLMTGTAMGTRNKAVNVVDGLNEEIRKVQDIVNLASFAPKNAMITLSVDKSPWTSGHGTYASDALNKLSVNNSFASETGWVMINSEFLVDKTIDYVIVVFEDGPRTQMEYDSTIASLSNEWKATNAYANGQIYFLTDSATDLASRPGPRISQFVELLARIVQSQAFDEDLPKFIGNDYRDYLAYTKDPIPTEIL